MNGVIQDLKKGLTLIVVSSLKGFEGTSVHVNELGKAAPKLVEKAYKEQGVPDAKERILSWRDGKSELNGGPYHQMFLLHNRQLIGVRYSEQRYIRDLGQIIMDYVPPTMLSDDIRGIPGAFEMLLNYTGHASSKGPFVIFNDGLGLTKESLAQHGFYKSECPIFVPPLNAETPEQWNKVLDKPVYMFARPLSKEFSISKEAARFLFVGLYIGEGYTDPVGEEGGVTLREPPVAKLPAAQKTIKAIRDARGDEIVFHKVE
jgi:hypothetical protein